MWILSTRTGAREPPVRRPGCGQSTNEEFLPEWRGGDRKRGGMKFQSPSIQHESGNLLFFLPPFPTSPFSFGEIWISGAPTQPASSSQGLSDSESLTYIYIYIYIYFGDFTEILILRFTEIYWDSRFVDSWHADWPRIPSYIISYLSISLILYIIL